MTKVFVFSTNLILLSPSVHLMEIIDNLHLEFVVLSITVMHELKTLLLKF